MAEKENIITFTYDLLKYIVPQLAKYPRNQKFVLADRIQVLLMDILDLFIEAYYNKVKEEKLALLRRANGKALFFHLSYWVGNKQTAISSIFPAALPAPAAPPPRKAPSR